MEKKSWKWEHNFFFINLSNGTNKNVSQKFVSVVKG